MCGPAAGLAGGALQAYGTISAGQAAAEEGKVTQQLRHQEAERIRQLGFLEENAVRRTNRRKMGQQIVDEIKAGFDPTSGTALDLAYDSAREAELTALNIRAGQQIKAESRINEGNFARYRGKAAETASYFTAGGQLLTAASKNPALQ